MAAGRRKVIRPIISMATGRRTKRSKVKWHVGTAIQHSYLGPEPGCTLTSALRSAVRICPVRPASSCWIAYIHSAKSSLIPKTIWNRKRDCAWGCAQGINTTRENLQLTKHKSVRWAKRMPSWFVLCDLQIFSGGVYPPSPTSRTVSFSISNSFWC